MFLVLGLFALGFWWRRRHETTQLLLFALSVLFYLRCLHYYLDDTWIPGAWFTWMTVNSIGWLNVGAYFFAFRLYDQRFPRFERFLLVAMLAASFITLPFGFFRVSLPLFSPLAYLVFTVVSISVAGLLSVVAWRLRRAECTALAAILWLNIGLGVHDWMLQNWRTDIESIYLLPVGVVALLAMFLLTQLRRYLGALSASERSGALLEARLADRERELRASYDRLREIEQAQLLSQERQRLMREMHDGLGSALMSSLIAVERGQMQSADVVQVLRECVDDLKLTIDSLEPVGDDLLILLATLRFRLEGRLQAAGITLIWEVETVPSLGWLNPSLSLHILRIVQEILTNVLKHAHARTIRFAATHDDEFIVISVEDDGVGFDVGRDGGGRGLSNLRQRAAALGAALDLESRPGATRVWLKLPIRRPVAGE
jgi:signal transduction histidine kinase